MLSFQIWEGRPALHGEFEIYAGLKNGKACPDDQWNRDRYVYYGLSGAFIEHVTDLDTSRFSYGIFDDTGIDKGKGKKHLILITGKFTANDKWFSDLQEMIDDYEQEDELRCAILKVVDKPIALGLHPDRLYEFFEYDPMGATTHDLFHAENGQERAETLSALYQDVSSSWLCKHLCVPDGIAFRIREYVTPAPVFFLRKEDLVLTVEDSTGNDFPRILVFRKSAAS